MGLVVGTGVALLIGFVALAVAAASLVYAAVGVTVFAIAVALVVLLRLPPGLLAILVVAGCWFGYRRYKGKGSGGKRSPGPQRGEGSRATEA